jgi:hypothetical protein
MNFRIEVICVADNGTEQRREIRWCHRIVAGFLKAIEKSRIGNPLSTYLKHDPLLPETSLPCHLCKHNLHK